jgi:NAD(P)-dependent dehydrogenase (short-subunit alcohol dehydrogenase family)
MELPCVWPPMDVLTSAMHRAISWQDTPLEQARALFDVNYMGAAALAKAFAPGMIRRRSGTIINVGCAAGSACWAVGSLCFGQLCEIDETLAKETYRCRLKGEKQTLAVCIAACCNQCKPCHTQSPVAACMLPAAHCHLRPQQVRQWILVNALHGALLCIQGSAQGLLGQPQARDCCGWASHRWQLSQEHVGSLLCNPEPAAAPPCSSVLSQAFPLLPAPSASHCCLPILSPALAFTCRLELLPFNIHVVHAAPGFVKTVRGTYGCRQAPPAGAWAHA